MIGSIVRGNRWVLAACIAAVVSFSCAYAQDQTAEKSEGYQKQWFMYWGVCNVHPRLEESEGQINRQLNYTVGRLVLGWKDPITFKDWSDEYRLWDGHLGLGRDINPKLSWFVGTGGTAGTVINDDFYALPPIEAKVSFTRRLYFVIGGLDYYPWGKPEWDSESTKSGLSKAISGTRPYAELATAFVHLKTIADAKFRLGGKLTLLKKYEETNYNQFHISPRIGIETPLGKNDSVALMAGYIFFDGHNEEFDLSSFYIMHKHRF